MNTPTPKAASQRDAEAAKRTPIPFAPGWNQHRWEQLFALEKLLNEVTMINHGSHCLERIQRCIAIAEELRRYDLTTPTASLVSFLKDQALNKQVTS